LAQVTTKVTLGAWSKRAAVRVKIMATGAVIHPHMNGRPAFPGYKENGNAKNGKPYDHDTFYFHFENLPLK